MKEQLAKILGLTGGPSGDLVREIPLDDLAPNPYQPRRRFAKEEMAELAESIRQYGVLQPVVARPAPEGLELVAGERRLRACKMLGLMTIPTIVKELTDQDMAIL
ncbi:MAG: ParB/RepB/Spo0J family partition protein, partial [Firmicutes bacterium]|nr:ParB/RepB/Spo0J family partition protein [Bacillota bacterium]